MNKIEKDSFRNIIHGKDGFTEWANHTFQKEFDVDKYKGFIDEDFFRITYHILNENVNKFKSIINKYRDLPKPFELRRRMKA